jgi:DNA-binding HxlR family transcriptional regulator
MDMPASHGISAHCRKMSSVLTIVGDKWTVMIVMVLTERSRRFNDIKRTIGGISQQMLTRTLKALERDGMVSRTVHPTVPPQVEYALTELGHSLAEPLRALGAWAGGHLEEIEGNRLRYDVRTAGVAGSSARAA